MTNTFSREDLRRSFAQEGYAVAPGLFSQEEVAFYRQHFMAMREAGAHPGDAPEPDPTSDDPLKRYPRMIHMHRWDVTSLAWLTDDRLRACLAACLGEEPFAVQTMLYFKPPGGRGQALHQDQHFLRVEPGTCIAAWCALDACDEANGCLQVVPGSHRLPLLCTQQADASQSFTDVEVQLPEGLTPTPVPLAPGDVLFFHGQLIHGSFSNTSSDRFRRALIGHYIMARAEKIEPYYHPVLRMDSTEVPLGSNSKGGPCGVWVERDGKQVVELTMSNKQ